MGFEFHSISFKLPDHYQTVMRHSTSYAFATAMVVIVLLSFSFEASAQYVLQGQIISDTEEPVPFASVVLLNSSDSSLVKGAITDIEGKFSVQAPESIQYLLSVSAMGFIDYFQMVNSSTTIGRLTINESSELLEEVIVEGKKPLFEQKIDRTVVNVGSSVTASGGTALDVLARSPGVVVDRHNGALSL